MKLVALHIVACAVSLAVQGPQAAIKSLPATPKALRDFHSWTRVNPKPVSISYYVDTLCRTPTLAESARSSANPHRQKFVTVWVNSKGKKAMFDGKDFPVGSAIVKEKRVGPNGQIELSTAMTKRERGFNPACGDWEFVVLDAEGRLATAHDKLKVCASCHVEQAKSDFTYRSYVPRSRQADSPSTSQTD